MSTGFLLLVSLFCVGSQNFGRVLGQECGKVMSGATTPSGGEARRGEFPWNVGLYTNITDGKWTLFCGGTLIGPNLVLTAAHCTLLSRGRVQVGELKVALGKVDRHLNTTEPSSVVSTVNSIEHPRLYLGHRLNHALDIALIQLSQDVEYNQYIQPVCVEWDPSIQLPKTRERAWIAGWGVTPTSQLHKKLHSEELEHLDLTTCLNEPAVKDKNIMTHDKFCGKSVKKGAAVARGYNGGGLTVVRGADRRHFLIGIANLDLHGDSEIATFTNILNVQNAVWFQRQRTVLGAGQMIRIPLPTNDEEEEYFVFAETSEGKEPVIVAGSSA